MVKLYTKTVCPKCMLAKSLFENNGVEYQVINIDQDSESKQKIIDEGFMAVPIVEYDGKFYTNMSEFESLVDELK
ncbi:glutaredoxin [Heyndrickxia oleronia]|uniref:glutaredoxin family protein n=1 Tax=Heyndrickxia oleronia TaxID=38875 RepID=UPI00039B743D